MGKSEIKKGGHFQEAGPLTFHKSLILQGSEILFIMSAVHNPQDQRTICELTLVTDVRPQGCMYGRITNAEEVALLNVPIKFSCSPGQEFSSLKSRRRPNRRKRFASFEPVAWLAQPS